MTPEQAAEYRAVRQAAGIAERTDRARIRLWGRDPVKMVQGLVTNDLAGAPEGQGVYAALLTPKGRMIAELRAFRRAGAGGVEVLLDLPREALEGTRAHLQRMVPPLFARWADVSDELGALGVYGPRSRELLERVLDAPVPELAEDATHEAAFAREPVLAAGTRDAGLEEGYDLFAAASALPGLRAALLELGAHPVGRETLEVLRIEAGRPRYGAELSEEVIPTEAYGEAGLLHRAVSFTKGCYTGQEVIVRIAHRGHVNRHLRGLLLGDAPAPDPGARLFDPATGKDTGRVTSAAVSPRLGQTVALGYVRREVEPGGVVKVGAADGPAATVARLPFEPPPG
ncbi:MAG TPA: glycine cleavage T C-terminal barrel domain-containing protein [Longimicrobiaceae bacterium]|nr:glycine cleavage T C-terminal barrel domain-containing protein [Longimicrobiaceae bacterium]